MASVSTPDRPPLRTGPVTRSAAAKQRLAAQGTPMPSISDRTKENMKAPSSTASAHYEPSKPSKAPAKRNSRRKGQSAGKKNAVKETPSEEPEEQSTADDTTEKSTAQSTSSPTKSTPSTHLAPESAKSEKDDSSRNSTIGSISRSASPLGLIPLHERYRRFIHRHEIPRKFLHVSIGFFTLNFYRLGIQTFQITPWLMTALIPIATLDIIRHRFKYFNHLYIQVVGALMRECEVNGYNGVIWYLLGAWSVLYFYPKDVGVMGVLLLSWCDTAASTFGRAWGKYTPKLRQGKSLAGTAAAFVTGALTSAFFWGYLASRIGPFPNDPPHAFMFDGTLHLVPSFLRESVDVEDVVIKGPAALGVMSLWTGVVAALSELIDVFGWDDNLTIPVLSGFGLWGFLKFFG
ncbi:hypothetical protein KEM55_007225 [Ascosphaera atra]|nr:hypothetical protein KEM55_007225 [Ascosphaera atra]